MCRKHPRGQAAGEATQLETQRDVFVALRERLLCYVDALRQLFLQAIDRQLFSEAAHAIQRLTGKASHGHGVNHRLACAHFSIFVLVCDLGRWHGSMLQIVS